jgi:hypothetical protein
MMGERRVRRDVLFYELSLERHVPERHLLRSIDRSDQADASDRTRVEGAAGLPPDAAGRAKLDRLRLRGPNGARNEFHVAATAQNLRKLAKLIPAPAPTPAI